MNCSGHPGRRAGYDTFPPEEGNVGTTRVRCRLKSLLAIWSRFSLCTGWHLRSSGVGFWASETSWLPPARGSVASTCGSLASPGTSTVSEVATTGSPLAFAAGASASFPCVPTCSVASVANGVAAVVGAASVAVIPTWLPCVPACSAAVASEEGLFEAPEAAVEAAVFGFLPWDLVISSVAKTGTMMLP